MESNIEKSNENIEKKVKMIEEYTTRLKDIKKTSNMVYVANFASIAVLLNSIFVKKDVVGSVASITAIALLLKINLKLLKDENNLKEEIEELNISSEVVECYNIAPFNYTYQRKLK